MAGKIGQKQGKSKVVPDLKMYKYYKVIVIESKGQKRRTKDF